MSPSGTRKTFRSTGQGDGRCAPKIVGFNPQPDPPGVYAATLEVFSRFTGRTSIRLSGIAVGPGEHEDRAALARDQRIALDKLANVQKRNS